MIENEYLANIISKQLGVGSPVVLVSIMSQKGSTPRHDGAKMVVAVDGKGYGTIGGSLIEADAIWESRKVLSSATSRIIMHELTGKDATDPAMVCGGTAEILLDYFNSTLENRELTRRWINAIQQGKEFYLLTVVQGDGEIVEISGRGILFNDKTLFLTGSLNLSHIEKMWPELHNISSTSVLTLGHDRLMIDRMRKTKTLFCFGAGHVAVPTTHLAALVGFRVIVVDDRPEFVVANRFPEASEVRVADFNRAFERLEIDNDSFIVIITRCHQTDRVVLEQAIKTNAGYVGMICSKRKRQIVFNALIAQGVSRERLEWVHSPIGLDIFAETPEEIAVSIVAELIQVRSRQSK